MFRLLKKLFGLNTKAPKRAALDDSHPGGGNKPSSQPKEAGAANASAAVQKEAKPAPADISKQTKDQPVTNKVPQGDAPVRLLIASEFVKFTDGVPFYEIVPSTAFVEVPYSAFLEEYSKTTGVISWRWKAAKPVSRADAVECMKTKNPVPKALVTYVQDAINKNTSIKYVWLDWSCAPQYPEGDIGATMREINRSGSYYRTAAHIIVWCFEEVGADTFSFSDYFDRAWTLSERLNRSRSESFLRGTDIIPLCLSTAMTSPTVALRLAPDLTGWESRCSREIEGMKVLDRLNTETMIGFAERILVARYPLLDTTFSAMNDERSKAGILTKVLAAPVLALATTALLLKAASEWVKKPDNVSRMTVSLKLGMDYDEFVIFTISSIVQAGRMRINNLPDKSLSNSLESYVGMEEGLRGGVDRQGAIAKLDECAAKIFDLALQARIVEVADEEWLARYLTYEIGSYGAFVEYDKLFAVYKLFEGMQNRTYNDTQLVWSDLCFKAGTSLRFLSSDEYEQPWLMELSVVNSEKDVGRPFFAVNSRKAPKEMPSSHPLNFGVLAYPKHRSGSMTMERVFCAPKLVEVDEMLTYFLGFNLDARSIVALSGLKHFTLVDKRQGTEIDTHLSLRGRKALEVFENELHDQIRALTNVATVGTEPKVRFVTHNNNGIFICVRYDGRRNLSKVVLVRTSLSEPGVWCTEAIAVFTGEPQKGSSWGVAKCLDNLIKDVCGLSADIAFACKQFGMSDPWSETVRMLNESMARGDRSFFDTWTLSAKNNPQPNTGSDKSMLPQDDAVESDEVDLSDLLVAGKTTFDPVTEFARVRKAFALVKSQNSSAMNIYYQILQRNYLVDTVMAQKIEYFGNLCDLLAEQIKELPSLLRVSLIKQFFDYLVEDMIDAVDMAEDRVSDDVLEKVRAQRRNLMNIVEGE